MASCGVRVVFIPSCLLSLFLLCCLHVVRVMNACRVCHACYGYGWQVPSGLVMKSVKDLPARVDWRETPNVVSSVKDQGHCGSCWAFSATEALESHVALATGLLYDLSPQQIAMWSVTHSLPPLLTWSLGHFLLH